MAKVAHTWSVAAVRVEDGTPPGAFPGEKIGLRATKMPDGRIMVPFSRLKMGNSGEIT